MITKSERTVYMACHLTPADKDRLKQEADRRKISMSALAAELIAKGLNVCVES